MAIDPFLVSLTVLTVAIIAGIVYLVIISLNESRWSQAVEMRVVMEGDAASVTTQDVDAMRRTFALKSGVGPSQVDVEVSSGSIVVDFVAWTDDATEVSSRLSKVQSQEWQAAFQQESTFPVKIVRVTEPSIRGGIGGEDDAVDDAGDDGGDDGVDDGADDAVDGCWVSDTTPLPERQPNWYDSSLRHDCSGPRSATVPHLTEPLFVTMPTDPLLPDEEFDVLLFANTALSNTQFDCGDIVCELYQFDIFMEYDASALTFVSSTSSDYYSGAWVDHNEASATVRHTATGLSSRYPSAAYANDRRGMFFLIKYRMRVKGDLSAGVKSSVFGVRVGTFSGNDQMDTQMTPSDSNKDARVLDYRDSLPERQIKGDIEVACLLEVKVWLNYSYHKDELNTDGSTHEMYLAYNESELDFVSSEVFINDPNLSDVTGDVLTIHEPFSTKFEKVNFRDDFPFDPDSCDDKCKGVEFLLSAAKSPTWNEFHFATVKFKMKSMKGPLSLFLDYVTIADELRVLPTANLVFGEDDQVQNDIVRIEATTCGGS